jgi:hypothetical protein
VRKHQFQIAMENQDDDAYEALLSEGAVLHSPVLRRPFVGRDTVAPLLGLLRACFVDPVYTDALEAPGTLGLVFRAKIADLEAEGMQLLRFDETGAIADITGMLRPIRAAWALSEAMGPRIVKLEDGTFGLRAPENDADA